MAKILHTGDIHLDSPFSLLTQDEQKMRRASLRNLFSKIIDIANEENVDILLLAGDIFDTYPIHPETAESFIRDLNRAKMHVFITPGNHDPYTPESPYQTLSFPDKIHIFTSKNLESIELSELNVRVFGAAYTSEVFDERILDGFSIPNDDFINIIALHSNLYGEGYCPVSPAELESTGADYIALAHVHKPTDVLKAGKTSYAYCGCLESRDFGESYESGFYIGEVKKGTANLERRTISDIVYRELTLNVKEYPDIISALPSPRRQEYLRLTLTGEGEPIDIEELKSSLSGKYASLEIRDNTTTPRDIWQGLGEDSLRGVFLRKMMEKLNTCSDEREKEKLLLATRLGINAIENRDE